MNLETKVAVGAGAGLVALGALYWLYRRIAEGGAADAGKFLVGAAADAAVGAVKGIGEVFGVPDTNVSECERALAEGRYWDASFKCPASAFIKGVFKPAPSAPAADPYSINPRERN